MGYLRRLDDNVDIQAFPGATFEAAGDVPAAQCTEAQIEGNTARTDTASQKLHQTGAPFEGFDLTGKVCHITASVGGNIGDFNIISNSHIRLFFDTDPGDGDPVTYHVTDAGEFELTRNIASLAAFIHAAGYAYTFKAGKLYTNMPSGLLKDACTILFDPLT